MHQRETERGRRKEGWSGVESIPIHFRSWSGRIQRPPIRCERGRSHPHGPRGRRKEGYPRVDRRSLPRRGSQRFLRAPPFASLDRNGWTGIPSLEPLPSSGWTPSSAIDVDDPVPSVPPRSSPLILPPWIAGFESIPSTHLPYPYVPSRTPDGPSVHVRCRTRTPLPPGGPRPSGIRTPSSLEPPLRGVRMPVPWVWWTTSACFATTSIARFRRTSKRRIAAWSVHVRREREGRAPNRPLSELEASSAAVCTKKGGRRRVEEADVRRPTSPEAKPSGRRDASARAILRRTRGRKGRTRTCEGIGLGKERDKRTKRRKQKRKRREVHDATRRTSAPT